jgi:hypothetical protein
MVKISGRRSDALPALVAAKYLDLDVTFEETDNLGLVKALAGPFTAPSLVLETSRGPIHFAGPVLRYISGLKLDSGIGGITEIEVCAKQRLKAHVIFLLLHL